MPASLDNFKLSIPRCVLMPYICEKKVKTDLGKVLIFFELTNT